MTGSRIEGDGAGFACPPLDGDGAGGGDGELVTLGHGGGGVLSHELIDRIFRPAFASATGGVAAEPFADAAVLPVAAALAGGGRLAFSTDAFVVRPLFFPGGSIGELAVHGTINDLAMTAARPLWLSAAFVVEEGLPLATLAEIARRMGRAATAAGVTIVTGDTKVVDRGHGDGCYVTTAGIGVVPPGVDLAARRIVPGDLVLVSGTLGDHGMAIMSVREGLAFEAEIASDTAPLHDLVAGLLAACPHLRLLRDPTRGGLAAALNEIAAAAALGIEIDEASVPVAPAVAAACEILGLDPLLVANEGKLVAVVPEAEAEAAIAAVRSHPLGRAAAVIGRVVAGHPGMVVARTPLGGSRVVPLPLGEQLPRIC
jgi:hydrogenase expression/formation protein HypE